MPPRGSKPDRLSEVERKLDSLERSAARLAARPAAVPGVSAGRVLGTIGAQLSAGGTATVTGQWWDGSAVAGNSISIVARDYFLPTGYTAAAGTKVIAEFMHDHEWWITGFAGGAGGLTSTGTVFQGVVQTGTGGGPGVNSAWEKDVVAGFGGYDTCTVDLFGAGAGILVQLPHVGGAAGREGPSPNLAAGNILTCVFLLDFGYAGEHEGGTSATVMTDSNLSLVTNSVIGWTITNVDDGNSSGVITANTATTVTVAALVGGDDQEWEAGDEYLISNPGTAAKAISDYTDDTIGAIKIWNASAATIPFGWEEDTEFTGRLPVGHDSSQTSEPDIRTIGMAALKDAGLEETSWHHNEDDPPDAWSHIDHDTDGTGDTVSGTTGDLITEPGHSQALHASPMRVVLFIRRFHE